MSLTRLFSQINTSRPFIVSFPHTKITIPNDNPQRISVAYLGKTSIILTPFEKHRYNDTNTNEPSKRKLLFSTQTFSFLPFFSTALRSHFISHADPENENSRRSLPYPRVFKYLRIRSRHLLQPTPEKEVLFCPPSRTKGFRSRDSAWDMPPARLSPFTVPFRFVFGSKSLPEVLESRSLCCVTSEMRFGVVLLYVLSRSSSVFACRACAEVGL